MKLADPDKWRTESRGTIVKLWSDEAGEYRFYDLGDGSLSEDPASDGIYSAEELLNEIDRQLSPLTKTGGYICIYIDRKRN